jgi:hypothetical protein
MIDVNGIEYKNCPRCNSEWHEFDGTFMCSKYFNKCIVASKTFNKSKIAYRLSLIIDDYSIEWSNGYCDINCCTIIDDMYGIGYTQYKYICKTPLLPHTITLDELKTYIEFS